MVFNIFREAKNVNHSGFYVHLNRGVNLFREKTVVISRMAILKPTPCYRECHAYLAYAERIIF